MARSVHTVIVDPNYPATRSLSQRRLTSVAIRRIPAHGGERRSRACRPRRMRCRVILEKKFATALGQEAEVGVKWKVQRG